jgi:hypothetical protein
VPHLFSQSFQGHDDLDCLRLEKRWRESAKFCLFLELGEADAQRSRLPLRKHRNDLWGLERIFDGRLQGELELTQLRHESHVAIEHLSEPFVKFLQIDANEPRVRRGCHVSLSFHTASQLLHPTHCHLVERVPARLLVFVILEFRAQLFQIPATAQSFA